jgi:acylphosphatase
MPCVIARRVVIRGLVQGVGFRYAAAHTAQSRGVTGWIANRPDGAVEAVFEGEPEAVESLVRWSARGPRGAHVDELDVADEEPTGRRSFEVR